MATIPWANVTEYKLRENTEFCLSMEFNLQCLAHSRYSLKFVT